MHVEDQSEVGLRGQRETQPISDYSKTLTATVLACGAYYRQLMDLPTSAQRSGAHIAKLESFLETSLFAQAKICETLFPGWDADPENAGYLIRQEPPAFFRVPAHLVAVFPNSAFLQQIWMLANSVRIHGSSIICLSGSNVVRQILEHVDDVDFCEYLPLRGGDLVADAVFSRLGESGDLICTAVKVGELKWPQTASAAELRNSLRSTNFRVAELATFKLDYISRLSEKRPFDVTSLAVLCDENFDSAGYSQTFSFQEAQVSASDYVPNKLTNAVEMGRYVSWLVSQVKKYRTDKNLIKSLKRALSLSRVCWMTIFSDQIKDFLSKTCFTIDQEILRTESIKIEILSRQDPKWADEILKIDSYVGLLKAERHAFLFKQNAFYSGSEEAAAVGLIDKILDSVAAQSGGVLR
ncbi:hypothetical protein [Roseomonas rosulenta]|uniref:hypothetical protein n=1 Tax=Roseomonas rosulenta TaxID=2748667 RepID=UPI0018DFA84E|nr:hypothetical protein [Roseomonas rosulenta]